MDVFFVLWSDADQTVRLLYFRFLNEFQIRHLKFLGLEFLNIVEDLNVVRIKSVFEVIWNLKMLLTSILVNKVLHFLLLKKIFLFLELLMKYFNLTWHSNVINFNSSFRWFKCESFLIKVLQEITRKLSHVIAQENWASFVWIGIIIHCPWFPTVSCRIRIKVTKILSSVLSDSKLSGDGSLSGIIFNVLSDVWVFLNIRIIIIRTTVTVIERIMSFTLGSLLSLLFELILYIELLPLFLLFVNWIPLVNDMPKGIRIISVPPVSLSLEIELGFGHDLILNNNFVLSEIPLIVLRTDLPWPFSAGFGIVSDSATVSAGPFPVFSDLLWLDSSPIPGVIDWSLHSVIACSLMV